MRKIVGLLILSFFVHAMQAQELPYAWNNSIQPLRVKSTTSTGFAYNVVDGHLDPNGNRLITGWYNGTVDFDPSAGETDLTSSLNAGATAGTQDIFIAKYNSQGVLQFALSIGNTGTIEMGTSIHHQPIGDQIVVTGTFSGTIDFDPGAGTSNLVASGPQDAFILILDKNGLFISAAKIGGTGTDTISKVLISSTGEIYVMGSFTGTVDIDPGAGTMNLVSQPSTSANTFLAKYNSTLATTTWANSFGASIGARLLLTTNNLYLTSNTNSSADYNFAAEIATVSNKNGSGDGIVVKYDLNGALVWLKTFGGDFFESIPSIVVDASDKIYLTGYFTGSTDLDPGAGTASYSSSGESDAYLMMWDVSGNLLWSKVWGSANDDLASSIGLLSGNYLVVAGIFEGTVDLDPSGSVTTVTSNGLYDTYLSYFNSGGTFIHGFSFGGQGSETTPVIATDATTRFEVVSNYTNTTDFDPTVDVNSLTVGNQSFPDIHISTYYALNALPTNQPTALVLNNQTSSSIDFSFTNAAVVPSGYIVMRKAGSAPTTVPKDGRTYSPGDIVGDGVVVQSGFSVSGSTLGLSANSSYFFSVYSYNGSGVFTNYLTASPLSGSTSTTTITFNRTSDSLALVSIYNAMGGAAWINKTNWLNASPTVTIDTWFGVTTTGTGNSLRVTGLSLNELVGQLPASIGNLNALTQLYLGADISGSIPPEIGNLTGLQELVLINNLLSGSIPQEIGNLSALTRIELYGNQLSGTIPSSLTNLNLLQILSLFNNKLTGNLPATIGNLSSIQELLVTNNQLSGNLPSSLFTLTTLTDLDLSNNLFTGSIPPEVGNLINLGTPGGLFGLGLGNNQFIGSIPNTIGNLINLRALDLSSNQLTGAVPASFTNLTNLVLLKLNNNQLTDLPDLSGISTLLSPNFRVSNNQFTFEDLEPNILKLGASTNYSPQAIFGSAQTLPIFSGQPLNLSFSVGGTANTYQWKRGTTNVGTNSNSFSVASATSTDAGTYTLTVTNSTVTGLTLTSANQAVTVTTKSEGLFEWMSAGALTSEGIPAPGTTVTDQNYSGQWGDFNNDGYEDIFLSGIATQERSYLYKNNGDGTFSKLTNGAYFYMTGRSVSWADYNNDGFLDCFAPGGTFAPDSVAYSSIFRNNGNSTFSRIQLAGNPTSIGGTWADTDNDGDLDLIVNVGTAYVSLYRNDSGTFVLVGGFNTNLGAQWNTIAADINNDRKIDIYIPDDNTRNLYFGNGNNTFALVTGNPVVSDALTVARGASFADIDNDGDLDAYLTSNAGSNMFYINNGSGNFSAQSPTLVLGEAVFGNRGTAFADYDNDGFVDLLTSQNTGSVIWVLFKNNGNGTFTKQTSQTFRSNGQLVGASFGDYNNDGFLDIVSASFGLDYNGLYRNKGNSNKWLQVKLTGKYSNRSAVGAKIDVYAGGIRRHHQVITNNGFGNQNSLIAQFGLGASAQVDSIRINWPSGFSNKYVTVASNQRMNITEVNSDSVALVNLYNATGGSNWTNKAGWLTGPLNTWYGVTIKNNRVAKLELYGNNMSGSLPSFIGDLTGLDTLALPGNKFTGSVPSALGNLKSLSFIDLGNNQFTGSLPAALFTLTQLKTFGFAGNQISGTIPAAIGNLVNIVNFWIDTNKFSGALPNEMNNLVNLKNFYIQNNEFTSIPTFTGFTLLGGSVQNNFLEFNSLVPNAAVANLSISPQKNFPSAATQTLAPGQSATFARTFLGSGNTYQWKKGTTNIAGANSDTYSISSVAPVNNGSYTLFVTNPGLPSVTLQTDPFFLTVGSAVIAEESGYQFYKEIGYRAQNILQVSSARDVAFDAAGNLYVLDSFDLNVKKFDASGNLVSVVGGQGTGDGLFTIPFSIVVDSLNNLFVLDFSLGRVQKFNSSGALVAKFGSAGTALGQFLQARGMAVNPATGNIYIADTGNNRVQIFNSNGNYVSSFGTFGTGNGQFRAPYKIYIKNSLVYVADRTNNRVQIFNTAGTYISQFGTAGSGNGQFAGPNEIVVDGSGDILVCDALNYRIQRFNSAGIFVSTFGSFGNTPGSMRGPESIAIASNGDILLGDIGNGPQRYTSAGTFINGYGNFGSTLGLLRGPQAVVKDSKGNRYVLESVNARVQKFDRNGNSVSSFGALGTGPGFFKFPQAIAIDRNDNIYISDSDNNTIQKFTSAGTYVATFGSTGTGDGQFSGIISMTFDQYNNLWVLESGNRRVQQVKSNGAFVSKFGVTGTALGQFNSPSAITVDLAGKIYVAETNPQRVQKFNPDGTFISSVGSEALNTAGSFNSPRGIASDFLNNIYVADFANNRIQKFEGGLNFLTQFGYTGTSNGDLFSGPGAVHTNISGDTLWISELPNRIQIWTAVPKKINATDSLALVSIYNSLGGASWTNKANWLTGKVETWYGVSMGAGRVRGLKLASNNLSGNLPDQIADLTQLLSLQLQSNKINLLPASFSSLANLQELNLSNNLLFSPFPTSISGLPNLRVVKIANNKLTGAVALPSSVFVAHINNNQLDQLPPLATQLDTLRAQANKFDFADLESNAAIKSISYSPQDSVSVVESVLKQLGESTTFTATTAGTTNAYQWKKDGVAVSGATSSTLAISNLSFSNDGVYQAAITNAQVPNLTLQSLKKTLRVSSLTRDSIALRGLYTLTNGASWTSKTNWLTTPLRNGNWFGVTITNNRVSSVSLPNNNLTGRAPFALADLQSVTTLNLSNNKITFVPDLKTLTNATAINLSGNRLDFESIVPNSKVPIVNYSNQADIGTASTELIDYGKNFTVKVSTKGTGNKFQWKRNGIAVTNATDTTYQIVSIGRANMGDFILEVTNPEVPGLTLKSAVKKVLAVASVSGKVLATTTSPAGKGKTYLLRVVKGSGYDTLGTKDLVTDGTYKFEKVILDDYQIVSVVDTVSYKKSLPTYYKNTILWEEAQVIAVNENLTGIDINVVYKPSNVPIGIGVISGTLTETIGSGRTAVDKRISNAGCMVRRVERTGRTEAETLTLVGYVFSNANGEFTLPNLTKGEYRLNIQYPGYPMDESSYVTIPIGDGLQSQVKVAANVVEGKIKVQKLIVTGIWEKEEYKAEVFPNPSVDYVQLQFAGVSQNRTIKLFDSTGKAVGEVDANDKEVRAEVKSLATGVYLLQVVDHHQVVKTIRIVKE